jgi:hypothetical protein
MPKWRDDIGALEFQPAAHRGLCMVHRRAFRTLLRMTPSPQCVDFYRSHEEAYRSGCTGNGSQITSS